MSFKRPLLSRAHQSYLSHTRHHGRRQEPRLRESLSVRLIHLSPSRKTLITPSSVILFRPAMTTAQQAETAVPITRKPSTSTDEEEEDTVPETLAERRALHNSVERSRREALNAKFTHLSQIMPSLSHIHRPSKSVIISHCLDMVTDLKDSRAENERLKKQIVQMRSLGTFSPRGSHLNPHRASLPSSSDLSLSPPLMSLSSSGRTPSPSKFQQAIYTEVEGERGGVPASALHSIQYRHSISGPVGYGPPTDIPVAYTSAYPQHISTYMASTSPRFDPIEQCFPVDYRIARLTHMESESTNSTDSISADTNEERDFAMAQQFYPPEYANGYEAQPGLEQFTFPSMSSYQSQI